MAIRIQCSILDHSVAAAEAPDIVRPWMLRCLVPLRGFRRLVQDGCLEDDGVARVVGLDGWVDRRGEDFNQRKVIADTCQNALPARFGRLCELPPALCGYPRG